MKRLSKFFSQDNSGGITEKPSGESEHRGIETKDLRSELFSRLLDTESIDIDKLRQAVWSGCPHDTPEFRVHAWKILLGYLPPRRDRHRDVHIRKLREYEMFTIENGKYLVADVNSLVDMDVRAVIHQIDIDIPRTAVCGCELVKIAPLVSLIRRILIIWSLRNPACGYVQGMNDITVPLLIVLVEGKLGRSIKQVSSDEVVSSDLLEIESDLYWMFSKIIQSLQDHYTSSQSGIQKMMRHFKELVNRIDSGSLLQYLDSHQIDLTQISFRWFNCLLVRELDYQSLIRVWDTCIAEEDGFSVFMVYFCVAWIKGQTDRLKLMDSEQLLDFFSGSCLAPAIKDTKRAESMLSEAFVLKALFHSSPHHLS